MKFVLLILTSFLAAPVFSQIITQAYKGKENNTEVFVITADGVKHSGTKFEFPKIFRTSNFIAIDGVKYNRKYKKDIIAYQNDSVYVVYDNYLEQDIIRLRKGKIELYGIIKNSTVGAGSNDYYIYNQYFLKRGNEQIVGANYENVEAYFADNKEVLKKMDALLPDHPKNGWPFYKTQPKKEQDYILEVMVTLVDKYNNINYPSE